MFLSPAMLAKLTAYAQTPYLDFRDLLLREKKGWEWQGTGDVEGAGAVEGWFAPPMFVILKNTLLKHLWL